MANMVSPFAINILDASGNVIGDGPLTNVLSLSTTERLDAVGDLTFTMPAADPRGQYITPGSRFDVWDEVDGYLGRYIYKRRAVTDSDRGSVLTVTAYDALRELSFETVGFRRTYEYVDVATVIADLVSVAGGWTADADANIGNTSVVFEGESVAVSVDAMRDRWGRHFRLGSTDPEDKVLQFGAFGDRASVHLTNLSGQVGIEIAGKTEVAHIDSIRFVDQSDEVFNSVIPLGAGQGTAQLTLGTVTITPSPGDYERQTGVNEDGTNFWYLQDADSVAEYGERWKVLTFSNVKPLENSLTHIVNATRQLWLSAEAYMKRHLTSRVEYAISLRGLRGALRVGDTVRVTYQGMVDGYGYLSVDEYFYVMDVTRRRDVSGDRTAAVAIATIAERRTSDSDILTEVMHDLRVLKVHTPITQCYTSVGPYTRRVSSIGAGVQPTFTVRLGAEVTFLNRAVLRFKTAPLQSSVTLAAAAGSGAVTTSEVAAQDLTTDSTDITHAHQIATQTVSAPGGSKTEWRDIYDSTLSAQYAVQLTVESTTPNNLLMTGNNNPSHDHDVTVPAHDHTVNVGDHEHDLEYGVFEDTSYPADVRVYINDVNVTAALGGPWGTVGAETEQELDITDYLNDAVGGLYQNHEIRFLANGQGEIECGVDMLVSLQPILIT